MIIKNGFCTYMHKVENQIAINRDAVGAHLTKWEPLISTLAIHYV